MTFSLLHALNGAASPPITSHVFQYPSDLMQPDLIVYVDQPEKPSLEKQKSVVLDIKSKIITNNTRIEQHLEIGISNCV